MELAWHQRDKFNMSPALYCAESGSYQNLYIFDSAALKHYWDNDDMIPVVGLMAGKDH